MPPNLTLKSMGAHARRHLTSRWAAKTSTINDNGRRPIALRIGYLEDGS
jgi:hypothetical protein